MLGLKHWFVHVSVRDMHDVGTIMVVHDGNKKAFDNIQPGAPFGAMHSVSRPIDSLPICTLPE